MRLLASCGLLCPGQAPAQAPVCQSHAPYFVVARNRTDSVNSDLLVKYGPDAHQCLYRVESSDYEVNDVNNSDFMKIAGSYLFLGGGSGPDIGEILIYDLKARRKLYSHTYMRGSFRLKGESASFTEDLGRAKPEQCKDYSKVSKMGLTPTLEGDVSFTLDDLAHAEKLNSVKPSNVRCVATQ